MVIERPSTKTVDTLEKFKQKPMLTNYTWVRKIKKPLIFKLQ